MRAEWRVSGGSQHGKTQVRESHVGSRGRSSAPSCSPPCSWPTASRPCARGAEQRVQEGARVCFPAPRARRDASVCVCEEAPLWVGWRKSAVCVEGGREGDTHRASWLFLLAFIVGSSIVWAPRARAGLRTGRASSSPGSVGWYVCARRGSGAGEKEERRGSREACASSAGRAMSKAAPCASEDEHAECATSVHVCGRYLRSCSAGALVQATDGACR